MMLSRAADSSSQPRHSYPRVSHHSGAGDTRPPPRSRTRPRAPRTTARRATRTPSRVVFAVPDLARQRAPCDGFATASRSSSTASRRARRATARDKTRKEPAPCHWLRSSGFRHHATDQNLTLFVFSGFSTSQDLRCWPLPCLPGRPPSAVPPRQRARLRPSWFQLAQGAQIGLVSSNRSTNSGGSESCFTSFRSRLSCWPLWGRTGEGSGSTGDNGTACCASARSLALTSAPPRRQAT